MSVVLIIIAAWLALNVLTVLAGFPLRLLKRRFAKHDEWMRGSRFLDPAIPGKGGWNDLSRWARFGGALKRPGPPAPMHKEGRRPR